MVGMRGIFLHKVVHTVHMALDLAHLRRQVVGVPITDVAKYFDLIVQGRPPEVGEHIGLGTKDHLFSHAQGYTYSIPLGPSEQTTKTSTR